MGAQLVQSVPLRFASGNMTSVMLPHPIQQGDSLIAIATFTYTQPFQVVWSDTREQSWVSVEATNCGTTAIALGYVASSTTDQMDSIMVTTSTFNSIIGLGVYEFSGLSASVGASVQCPDGTIGRVSTPSLRVLQPALLFAAYADTMSTMPYTIDQPFVTIDSISTTYTYAAAFDNGGNFGVPPGDYASATTASNMTNSWAGMIAAFATQ